MTGSSFEKPNEVIKARPSGIGGAVEVLTRSEFGDLIKSVDASPNLADELRRYVMKFDDEIRNSLDGNLPTGSKLQPFPFHKDLQKVLRASGYDRSNAGRIVSMSVGLITAELRKRIMVP